MRFLNDSRPWYGLQRGPGLSMADLIAGGTITAEPAAALWWALERGASAYVVALPQGAGKTTLASALLDFLPDETALYVTAGPADRLDVGRDPACLLVNELSNHTSFYLFGPAARRAFALLREGHRMIGALHAGSVAEAVAVMRADAGIPPSDIARITLVVVLRARRTADGVERRVVEIGLLSPNGDGDVAMRGVAGWDSGRRTLALLPAPGGITALAEWAGVAATDAEREVAARSEMLTWLAADGVGDPRAVAGAVRRLRRMEEAGHAPA